VTGTAVSLVFIDFLARAVLTIGLFMSEMSSKGFVAIVLRDCVAILVYLA
jgi:hypothetical protein